MCSIRDQNKKYKNCWLGYEMKARKLFVAPHTKTKPDNWHEMWVSLFLQPEFVFVNILIISARVFFDGASYVPCHPKSIKRKKI